MRECTIISKRRVRLLEFILLGCFLLGGFSLLASDAHAQDPGVGIPQAPGGPPSLGASSLPNGDPNAPSIPSGGRKDEPSLFDQSSPYLEYGDFNMNEDENADALYFQYGRFFGVSLGLGYETATGNRGKLYQPAMRFDVRLHYWFDFNFAMDLGVFFANHSFTSQGTLYQPKLIGYGIHLIYYFDVRDSSAALSFANPFLEVGAGQWSLSQSSLTTSTDQDSTLSIDFGGGLEFPIVYKKTYFILEALYHTQNFADSTETKYAPLPDLSGGFFTLMAHFMFVW